MIPSTRQPSMPAKRNLAREVVAALRADIISGIFRPGEALAEPVLAARFNVSRAPVREALIELEREGLVQFEATGRTRVRELIGKDLAEIVDVRMALEAMAARRAASLWTAADSAWINGNLAAQAKASTLAELSQLDVEMHEYIIHRSGNERLLTLWRCIRPQFEMWLAHTHRLQAKLKFEPCKVTVASHRKLLRIIESGDAEQAALAMAAHIESWHEWLPATFPSKPVPSPHRGKKKAAVALATLLMTLAHPAHGIDFETEVRPLLAERCNHCHSTKKQKGDLDLERFTSLAEVKKEPAVWQNVQEQLANNEMPPKKEPQLTGEQRSKLTSWVQTTLDDMALASAGDPGPVVLRRLSNMEYTYTIRDITGVATYDPAKEFPVDGAAGEGFTNAGAALVMSPTLLTKYMDAAKDIASHAVLTPAGLHFSAGDSSRDWTDETLAKIRSIYARYTANGDGSQVTHQGIKLDTGTGSGRLPLSAYLAALQGKGSAKDLNAKYLNTLRAALTDTKPSLLLDSLRAKFRAGNLTVTDIEPWQQSLWRFTTVGHIGKENGPKAWQEPLTPLAAEHEIHLPLIGPADGGDLTLYLATSDAGDGSANDSAVWQNPRLAAPGRKDLPLKHLPEILKQLDAQRSAMILALPDYLAAADEAEHNQERTDIAQLAKKHSVRDDVLKGWLDYLGIGSAGGAKLGPLLTKKLTSTPDYNFIKGWTGDNALSVLANSSDKTARTPGTMKPHSVATHPSPTLASVIAWRSPVAAALHISGNVTDVHTACGNGVTWSLQIRRGNAHDVLASGVTDAGKVMDIGKHEQVHVRPGDAVAIVIGPKDGNHTCDLTNIDLIISDGKQEWNLAKEISPDILAGNPHEDGHGNKAVWHFFGEPTTDHLAPQLPAGSLLSQWRNSADTAERKQLAARVQGLMQGGLAVIAKDSPNRALYQQLLSYNGPMLAAAWRSLKLPSDNSDIAAQAPGVLEFKIPATLADGTEFIATGKLQATEGSVQMHAGTTKPETLSGIASGKAETAQAKGQWSDNNLRTMHSAPVIVEAGSAARKRFEDAFDDFRALFPIALCYTKVVPVDEVVTLTLFHREDDHLKRLMLDEAQSKELDQLWDELRFVSESPLKQVDVFEQLFQFATQDAKPSAFEPMREPIKRGAETFKRLQLAVEPKQVQAVLDFAAQAWRRPLTSGEQNDLLALYQKLRTQDLPHAAAVRMLLARVLVAPPFLYRGETASPGAAAAAVNSWELATRLSYFLWSSSPDDELRSLAASGALLDPATLNAQATRMIKDAKVRRLATEFGCQWLQVRDVHSLDEKSERHFPTFAGLRGDMEEEVARFFMDLFQQDRSVLSLVDADYTFVNGALAKHYALDLKSDDWQRVDGLHSKGRGGLLGFAATLAKQAGASRTSPILRGGWLSEVVMGERLPVPPKGVPVLPEEAPQGLTERQLTEHHSRDPKCSGCHQRIDPFGFALEGFDAIGRARTQDAAGLRIDAKAQLPDGTFVDGLGGLRTYILTKRSDAFLRQFSRKFLGYALGRSVQFSDKPLIDAMIADLKSNDFRVTTAVGHVVRSPQFREVRGRDFQASK